MGAPAGLRIVSSATARHPVSAARPNAGSGNSNTAGARGLKRAVSRTNARSIAAIPGPFLLNGGIV